MLRVAFNTLGCKVNQYDSEAMLEAFEGAGYTAVPFSEAADVYVVNTCTVTGTGDKKSLQTIRRIRRLRPESELIIAGCLAQRMGEELLGLGARLVIGTQHRREVVALFERAMAENARVCAVESLENASFEPLGVSDREARTRAVMKIQEGCDRHCTYCIIPTVRGPIRSRPLEDVVREATILSEKGYRELVLTGIHLSSYGRDFSDGARLQEVICALDALPMVERIRLGSLEPNLITEAFMKAIAPLEKLCPQFHLALQSGCDSVLARMGRRYDMAMYRKAVFLIRESFPLAALTTDIIAGFPMETDEEHETTLKALFEIGFSKLHVFPYSIREGTKAAKMRGQLPKDVKDRRAKEIIALGEDMALTYRQKFLHTIQPVLFETVLESGMAEGYTREYLRVEAKGGVPGRVFNTDLVSLMPGGLLGTIT